jgi:hypothetical protein
MGISVVFTIFRLRVERLEPAVKLNNEQLGILIRKIKQNDINNDTNWHVKVK